MNDGTTDIAAGRAGSGPSAEFLEYGKPCVTTDGDIERGADYRELGRSVGFPSEISLLCRPQKLGPGGADELQVVLKGVRHATVLQPAVCAQGVVLVLSRTRVRREFPRHENRRRYWLARYLAFASHRPDPLTALQTMDAHPLVGLTSEQAASIGPPMDVVVAASASASARAQAFLAEAVPLVMSGIPVGIAGSIGERSFFEWMALLWRLLPVSLQGIFSAGWRVGPQRAETLTVSAASSYGETVATFEPGSGTWVMPAVVRVSPRNRGAPTRAFSRSHLVAGTSYARVHLGWTPRHRPVTAQAAVPASRCHADAALARFRGRPRVLSMADFAVIQTFRHPANRALDALRVGELEEWLSGARPAGSTLCVDTSVYRYRDTAQRAFEAGLAALGDPATQDRGDLVVSRSLATRFGRLHREAVGRRQGAGSARGELLVEAADGSLRRVVETLNRAVEAGEAGALPREVGARLNDQLDAALNDRAGGKWTRRVIDLLLQGSLPGIVHDWVRERPEGLAVAMARDDPERAPLALAQIRALVASSFVDMVATWITGGVPDPSYAALVAGLDETVRRAFGRVLVRAWKAPGESVAERRSELLLWIDLLGPLDTHEPLLCLRYGRGDLSERQTRIVTRYVVTGTVPSELCAVVAAAVLRHWHAFSVPVGARTQSWEPFLLQWPPRVYLALLGKAHPAPPARFDPRVERAARTFRPRREQLLKLARDWTRDADRREALDDVAPLLWQWCVDAGSSGGGVVDLIRLCAEIAAQRLPTQRPPRDEDLDQAAALARAAGALSRPLLERFLAHCHHGWQVRFALSLFPGEDVTLPLGLMEVLVNERSWLRKHLATSGIHPDRHRHLGLASFGFHTLKYTDNVRQWWRKGIEKTVLWAAFAGVPSQRRGSLRVAVEAYADEPRLRCRLAALFLDGQRRCPAGEREKAIDAVMEHVVSPVALQQNVDMEVLRQIFRVLEDGPPANGSSYWGWKAPLYKAYFAERSSGRPAVWREPPNQIWVSHWFRELLKAVYAPGRAARLLKIFRRAGGATPS